MHETLHFFGLHRWVGQGHVEVGLGGMSLKRPRRVHAGKGRGAHEGRRRGNGHDAMRADKAHQPIEGGAESVQQMIGRGMILSQLLDHSPRLLVRLQLFGDLIEMRLILAQVGPANLQ